MVNGWDCPVGTYELIETIIDEAERVAQDKSTLEMLGDIQEAYKTGAKYDALSQQWIEQALADNPEIAKELEALGVTASDIHEVMGIPVDAVLEVAEYTPY